MKSNTEGVTHMIYTTFDSVIAEPLEAYGKDTTTLLETSVDVTECIIARGDKYTVINNVTYRNEDYDYVVTGNAGLLLQHNSNLVVWYGGNDCSVITNVENPEHDTNWSHYYFVPKKNGTGRGGASTMTEKVVGTTFRFPNGQTPYYKLFDGTEVDANGTPGLTGTCVLVPEPDNQYDANAVMVIAKMADGKPLHIGYLPKGSQMQSQVTAPTPAILHIVAYSEGGDYNDSYTVTTQQ